jgi:hypothetical protein
VGHRRGGIEEQGLGLLRPQQQVPVGSTGGQQAFDEGFDELCPGPEKKARFQHGREDEGPGLLEITQTALQLSNVSVEVFRDGNPAQGAQHCRGRFRARPGLLAARESATRTSRLHEAVRDGYQIGRQAVLQQDHRPDAVGGGDRRRLTRQVAQVARPPHRFAVSVFDQAAPQRVRDILEYLKQGRSRRARQRPRDEPGSRTIGPGAQLGDQIPDNPPGPEVIIQHMGLRL